MASTRLLRVGEQIRHILAHALIHVDFFPEGWEAVTILVYEVRVGADLRRATVFCAPQGDNPPPEAVIKALNARAGIFNRKISQRLVMKFSPRLTFALDMRARQAQNIEALLSEAARRDGDT